MPFKPSRPWQDIHAAKKAEQAARIPAEWTLNKNDFPPVGTVDLRPVVASSKILLEQELKITKEYDATSLAASIADGTYTALEVVTAFCKRAAIGNQLCDSLTEIMFYDAIESAKKLDEHFKKTGKTVGPLHGVPMTFKVRSFACPAVVFYGFNAQRRLGVLSCERLRCERRIHL